MTKFYNTIHTKTDFMERFLFNYNDSKFIMDYLRMIKYYLSKFIQKYHSLTRLRIIYKFENILKTIVLKNC